MASRILSPASVNTFLGNIATALARKRAPMPSLWRTSTSLMLNSQAAIECEHKAI
jgi:hypothetical protein